MALTKITAQGVAYTKVGKSKLNKTGGNETAYPAQYVWCDKIKGFGMRVFPSGKKSFLVTYRNTANTKRFYTIGNYPDITVEQARHVAKLKLLEVSNGDDPQATRRGKKDEMTFEALARDYMVHSKEHKRSYKNDYQRLRDHLLPAFGQRKLSEITLPMLQQHMRKLHEKLAPATVNRCIALTKHMFTMAMRWQVVEASPAQHLQPYKEPPPCDVVLRPEECRRIIDACNQEDNPFAAALFKLALYTGRRIGEIRNARWEDVHHSNDAEYDYVRLTIRDTKAGEQQHVYLNELAAKVIASLDRVLGNPYIIAGAAPMRPLQTYSKAWKRILARAEVAYFKPHGLRHNYVSMLVAAGEPMDVVGHLVGHKNSVTTKKYAHHRPDGLRKTTERLGQVIELKR